SRSCIKEIFGSPRRIRSAHGLSVIRRVHSGQVMRKPIFSNAFLGGTSSPPSSLGALLSRYKLAHDPLGLGVHVRMLPKILGQRDDGRGVRALTQGALSSYNKAP